MKKTDFLPDDDTKCENFFGVIKFMVFLLAICFAFLAGFGQIHWVWAALVAFFYVWNILQYRKGCFSQVVDEYDDHKRGCPHDGLRRVYHSWKVFAIIVAMVVVWFITKP